MLAHAAAVPLAPSRVRLEDAAGLTLAEVLRARGPIPAFDTAAMDGYAICGAGPYRLRGQVTAGTTRHEVLRPDEAIGISTGAQVPTGATAILRLEDAVIEGNMVTGPHLAPGKHIRRAGEDAATGSQLAPEGSAIGPAMLGLAAACGYDHLVVTPRPQVRVVVTGGELIRSGVSGRGLVRDALGPMLPALVAEMGGNVIGMAYVPDRPANQLAAAVQAAADDDVPVIVVTGSTSVGPTDRLRRCLHQRGAGSIVDTVACRPGHPQLLAGLRPDQWIVGLPGNPFAALVAAHTLLAPLLAGLTGRPFPSLSTGYVVGDVRRPAAGLTRLIPVARDGGDMRALGGDRPPFLGGAALADGLAAIPADWTPALRVPLITL